MDSFQEVTSENVFSRLIGSFWAVLIGLLLIAIGGVLLFWNEKRAVVTARGLAEGGRAVVDVSADKVDASHDGHLVHVSGEATTKGVLKDPDYGVTAPTALLLSRTVEMYQYKEDVRTEKHTKVGGGTETVKTYNYAKIWSAQHIDSSTFRRREGHENPPQMPASNVFAATDATLGAYVMPDALLRRIDNYQPLTPDASAVAASPLGSGMRVAGDQLYKGADPAQPSIGDIRVHFRFAPPTVVSVIARQSGTTFEPYQTQSGDTLEMLTRGTIGSAEMFKSAEQSNEKTTWILRLVGYLLMSIGIGSLFSPLTTLASVLPIVGELLEFSVAFFALAIGAVISLVIIAVAWIVFRPWVGIGLLAAGLAVLVLAGRVRGAATARSS